MAHLHGSGSPATPPSPNLAPINHYDDVDDDGYVSLNRNGADEDQPDQWVDEEADTVPRLAANSNSRAVQPSGSLRRRRRRRRGSRALSARTRTSRATSYSPSRVTQDPSTSSPITEATTTGASRRQGQRAAPALAPEPAPPFPPPLPLEPSTTRMALHYMLTFVSPLFEYTVSIGRPSVRYLRYPLIIILLLFLVISLVIIFFIFLVASFLNGVSSALLSIFSPIHYGPGFSLTAMCKWVTYMTSLPTGSAYDPRKVMWAVYPGLVEIQSRRFEQLIDDILTSGTSGTSLSLHIKKAEMATADLVALVRLSKLPSKISLVKTLSDFERDARIAEESLHKLDSEVNGAIDSIMAMNNFAMQAIDSARANEPGAFAALMIWKPSEKTMDEVVKETFSDAMHYISKHLERLVEHGANCANLERLEQKLSTLRDIVAQENETLGEAKEKLLANLWTRLGGNRNDLRNLDRNLELLHGLTVYRESALAHVVAALQTVRTVDQELQGMRERVANFAGDKVAPDVHMNSIKNALKRLKEVRLRARRIAEETLRKALGLEENRRGLD
ncbi:hypothetical protein H1R20_g15150, partial [Candolleomyces eurysporus]